MAWGTTIDRVTTEINPFLYERETYISSVIVDQTSKNYFKEK